MGDILMVCHLTGMVQGKIALLKGPRFQDCKYRLSTADLCEEGLIKGWGLKSHEMAHPYTKIREEPPPLPGNMWKSICL